MACHQPEDRVARDVFVFSERKQVNTMVKTIYFAGGCLWGVQAFIKTLNQAGRANDYSNTLKGEYDGYAECVDSQFE